MTRTVAGAFPDRATAEQAMAALQAAGFAPTLDEDGQIGDWHGYTVAAEPIPNEADLRSLLMRSGALSLQGRGADAPGHPIDPAATEEQPIPVRNGERLPPGGPEAQAKAAAYAALDHGEKGAAKDAEEIEMPPEVRRAAVRREGADDALRQIGGSSH
jgi:hypothetical protein